MNRSPLRVVKFGGSLLGSGALRKRLQTWLLRQSEARTVLVVGGGLLVEEVRLNSQQDVAENEAVCEHKMHWECIDLMSVTAERFSQQTGFPVIESVSDLDAVQIGQCVIFRVADWLRENEHLLPFSWSVSSDSIAAALASELQAGELVLLKSCLPESGNLVGYVDAYFSVAALRYSGIAGHSQVRFVNFQDEAYSEIKY